MSSKFLDYTGLTTLVNKIKTLLNGKAPTSHASSATTYGVGTSSNYGHCKVIDNLTTSTASNGNALNAHQGYVLQQNKADKTELPTKTSDLQNDSGFGTYSKPSGGIPKTDLESAVQTSLGLADTSLQSVPDHASANTTYGVGTTANYGHCKTINDLTQSSYVDGEALSAYQGYLLSKYKSIQVIENGLTLVDGTGWPSDFSVNTFYLVNKISINGSYAIPIQGGSASNMLNRWVLIRTNSSGTGFEIAENTYHYGGAVNSNDSIQKVEIYYSSAVWNYKVVDYKASTADLTAGTSTLTTGSLYFVYE